MQKNSKKCSVFSPHFFLLKDKLIHTRMHPGNNSGCLQYLFLLRCCCTYINMISSDKNECASPDTNNCKLVNNVVCVDTNGSYVCNCVNSSYVKSQDSVCVGMWLLNFHQFLSLSPFECDCNLTAAVLYINDLFSLIIVIEIFI